MGVPTNVSGSAAESNSAAQTSGFLGWSPEADRTVYTVRNGSDGTAATAYATTTAYAVGKTVTYNGATYVVRTAVTSANTTAPDTNASFVPVDRRRGSAEYTDATTRRKQFYR
jgi:hypothetical protein